MRVVFPFLALASTYEGRESVPKYERCVAVKKQKRGGFWRVLTTKTLKITIFLNFWHFLGAKTVANLKQLTVEFFLSII